MAIISCVEKNDHQPTTDKTSHLHLDSISKIFYPCHCQCRTLIPVMVVLSEQYSFFPGLIPFAMRNYFICIEFCKVSHIKIVDKNHIIHKEENLWASTESNNVIRLSRNELFEDCLINENLSEIFHNLLVSPLMRRC